MRNVPRKYITMYKAAMTGKSRKQAMKSFCIECVSYQQNEVEACSDTGCPLYPYRMK